MLYIINNNKTNDKIKFYQNLNLKNYIIINNDIKADIIDSINLNKITFHQIIGLNNIYPEIFQLSKSNKKLISNNISNKNLIEKETTNNNDDRINENTNNNNNEKYHIEKDINLNLKKKIVPVTDEQIELFKTFVGNSTLSNHIILSYFDEFNPKVKFAAQKYFKSRYGSDYITINFFYPKKPGTIQHKFKFISEIQELFFIARNDFSINNIPKLFLENGKELVNNRKIKCIGALNLNNNSVIKVYNN